MADPGAVLRAVETKSEDARGLLDEFLPEPTMLDPVLRQCVNIIVVRHLDYQEPLELIYDFCKVRGTKIIEQLLPSDVEYLPRVLEMCENGDVSWQESYALLTWLSILVLTPFPLEIVGENIEDRLWALASRLVCVSSKAREAASVLCSRLVARQPRAEHVIKFVDWARRQLRKGWTEIGLLSATSGICRLAPSDSLISLVEKPVDGALASKLRLKCIGRLGLAIPSMLEYAVAECFEGLEDMSSMVRYTAAKYIARLTATMDDELTAEVDTALSTMFWEDFSPSMASVSTDRWQGVMLALAEMIRNGHCPGDALAMVGAALSLVQRRTRSSLGASVRDTACYVCWSLFRIKSDLRLDSVYRSLCVLACLDRELTVRLAAAAALQEGLGRRTDFSADQTLELLEMINFTTVRSLEHCYLHVAPRLPDEMKPGVDELMAHGIGSPIPEVRRLARHTFSLLHLSPSELLAKADKEDPDIRHGVMLCLGMLDNLSLDLSGWIYDSLSTDLECEAQLRLLAVMPEEYLYRMNACLKSEEDYVVDAARDLVRRRMPELRGLGISNGWRQHMGESITYVACIAEEGDQKLSLEAVRSVINPLGRVFAISALRENFSDTDAALFDALSDYQWDTRGDVGSWVRRAAVMKLRDWLPTKPRKNLEKQLWRLAAEPSAKVREESRAVLREIGYGIGEGDSCILQAVPAQFEEDVLLGMCRDYGSHGDKVPHDLRDYAEKLLDLERSTAVLRTISKLVQLGAKFSRRITAVAYNATLRSNSVFEGISMLTCLPLIPESLSRLIKLCGCSSAAVRQRAAEALFELGIEDDVLEKTNWEGGDWADAVRNLHKYCI